MNSNRQFLRCFGDANRSKLIAVKVADGLPNRGRQVLETRLTSTKQSSPQAFDRHKFRALRNRILAPIHPYGARFSHFSFPLSSAARPFWRLTPGQPFRE